MNPEDEDEEILRQALALNKALKKKTRKQLERERDDLHMMRHMREIASGTQKATFGTHHVAASKILRKKIDAKISRENRQIATRLEQSWSSGYGARRCVRGPLAKKIHEARINRKPRLQQPDMEF